ncbi:MAG TPA: phosphatase PAP2 family protein [Solirubrobacteraceae bacterium]
MSAALARAWAAVWTGWRFQVVLYVSAYALYGLARWLFVGETAVADANAHSIVELERSLHVAVERSVQHALDVGVLIRILNFIYLAAQLAAVPAALIWLYRRSPRVYRTLRNTILATWVLAIPVYALFPVAPPRLAHVGIVDTLAGPGPGILDSHLATAMYNPLAAVPSLHVGFAFAVGVACAMSLNRVWAKGLVLVWGPLVSIAVVATGNHFVFDLVAGIVITAIGYATGRALAGWLDRRARPARTAKPPAAASSPAS